MLRRQEISTKHLNKLLDSNANRRRSARGDQASGVSQVVHVSHGICCYADTALFVALYF